MMLRQKLDVRLDASGVAVCLLLVATLFVGGLLISTKVTADQVIDQVSVIVPPMCSLTGSIEVGEEHTATTMPGAYVQDIGTTNLKVLCNDYEGFALYAVGYTGDVEGGTNLVGVNTSEVIATGTATSGDTSNWAMKLTKVDNPGGGASDVTYQPENLTILNSFSSYHAVPSSYTKVAAYHAATGSSATDQVLGSNIETTYAAFVATNQVADTYVGRVKYLLVHPASVDYVSTNGITAVYQAYPGSGATFADGSTTNTVVFRKVCEADAGGGEYASCHWMVTDGEYKEPIGYKGAWLVPLNPSNPDVFVDQNGVDDWIYTLNNMNGADSFLGMTIPVYTYDGHAVVYDGNGATAGDMSHVASRFGRSGSGGTADLIAPNFYKSGYGFVGWSTSSSATPTNGATIYGPNETVDESDFSYDANGNVTLYAVWVQSTGSMQDFVCSSLTVGGITALTDARDGNTYAVGRAGDGNCWMLENLRLGGSAVLNSGNTHNPAISSLGLSKDVWCDTQNADCVNQAFINTNNTNVGGVNELGKPLVSTDQTDTLILYGERAQWYGYGNYYNWYAATAGTGTYGSSHGDNAPGDICPKGWGLPSKAQYGILANVTATDYPYNLVRAGMYTRVYTGSFVWAVLYSAFRAAYWTRTAVSGASAYYFDGENADDSSIIMPYGLSVRCLWPGS